MDEGWTGGRGAEQIAKPGMMAAERELQGSQSFAGAVSICGETVIAPDMCAA